MTYIRYGLAISLAYPSGEEEDVLLVHLISACLPCAYRKGGGGSAHCGLDEKILFLSYVENIGNLEISLLIVHSDQAKCLGNLLNVLKIHLLICTAKYAANTY